MWPLVIDQITSSSELPLPSLRESNEDSALRMRVLYWHWQSRSQSWLKDANYDHKNDYMDENHRNNPVDENDLSNPVGSHCFSEPRQLVEDSSLSPPPTFRFHPLCFCMLVFCIFVILWFCTVVFLISIPDCWVHPPLKPLLAPSPSYAAAEAWASFGWFSSSSSLNSAVFSLFISTG